MIGEYPEHSQCIAPSAARNGGLIAFPHKARLMSGSIDELIIQSLQDLPGQRPPRTSVIVPVTGDDPIDRLGLVAVLSCESGNGKASSEQ